MARITGFTSERMLEIEGTTIVDGSINEGGNLILHRRDGFTIDAGKVTGPTGAHGSGVSDVNIFYQSGTSGTIEPTGEWVTSPPIVHPGDYLWVKTVTTYADPEDPNLTFDTVTFTVTLQPESGKDGRGIVDQNTQYQQSVSGITAPTGDWYPTPPVVTPGNYLWARTTTTYTYGAPHLSYSVSKQGIDGSDGTPGDPGADGRTQYLHVAYSSSADGSVNFSTSDPSGRSYMGTTTTFYEADPIDFQDYKWTRITGESGVGISSSSVRYQESTSGTVAPIGTWLVDVPSIAEGHFLWSRTIVNFTDGGSQTTYSVSKRGEDGMDGSDGRGITSIVEQYYLSTSSSALSGDSWSETRPEWEPGKYYWTRTVFNYTTGNPTTTDPICVSGDMGSDGRSVANVDVYYYLSNSELILSGGTWNTVAPAWVVGKYLWTKTVTTYSDGGNDESDPACITGSPGTDGNDGVGIELTTIDYAVSSSGTVEPTSGWVSSVPNANPGQFIWTRTRIDYTDGSDSVSYSVSLMGEKGEQGDATYTWIRYATDQNGSGISSNPIGKSYIGVAYNKLTSVATNNPGDYTWSLIKGADGVDGVDGNGVSGAVTTYQAHSSGTEVPTGTWLADPPFVAPGMYLWSRTVTAYTTGSPTIAYSVAAHGSPGTDGVSVTSTTPFYWLGILKPASPTVLTPPAPWQVTEPQYTLGTANNLFVVIRTVYSNGTFSYTAVSESASFATAKVAYETATTAGQDAQQALDDSSLAWKLANTVFADSPNKAPNGSFEMGLAPWGNNFGSSETRIIAVPDAHHGDNVAQIPVSNSVEHFYFVQIHAAIPTSGGRIWETTARFRQTNDIVGRAAVGIQTSTNGTSYAGTNASRTTLEQSTEWVELKHTYVVPEGVVLVSPYVGGANAGTNIEVDSVTFKDITDEVTTLAKAESGILLGEQALLGIDQAREDLALEYSTEISESMGEIMLTVSTEYATKDEMVDEVGAVISQIEQNSQNVDIRFLEVSEATVEVEDELTRYKSEVANYIRFSAQGIELGKTGSPFVARLSNSELAFLESGKKVAYVSNNQLHITNAEVKNNLAMGTETTGFFDFIPRANGNLSFKFRPGSGS